MSSEFWLAEARFDWATYVREHGGVRAVHGRSDEYLLQCPACGKAKLAVNVSKRAWRCFTCSVGGKDAASLVAQVEAVPWHHSLARVMGSGARAPIGALDRLVAELDPSERPAPASWKERVWPDGWRPLGPIFAAQAQGYPVAMDPSLEVPARAAAYVASRRIPSYVVDAMRLGVCVEGPFRARVVFPCFDAGGRLVFFQGRATWPPHPRELRHIKTLSPRSEDGYAGPSDCLLNLGWVADRIEEFEHRVLIVEGPIDCAHAWPDAVATWGKKISPRQIEILVRAGVRAVDLCWDADAASDMARIAPVLCDLFEVRIVDLPEGRDPGDLTKEEIELHRARARRMGSGDRLERLT